MIIFFVVAALCVQAVYSAVRSLKDKQGNARGEITIIAASFMCFVMAAALAFMHML